MKGRAVRSGAGVYCGRARAKMEILGNTAHAAIRLREPKPAQRGRRRSNLRCRLASLALPRRQRGARLDLHGPATRVPRDPVRLSSHVVYDTIHRYVDGPVARLDLLGMLGGSPGGTSPRAARARETSGDELPRMLAPSNRSPLRFGWPRESLSSVGGKVS